MIQRKQGMKRTGGLKRSGKLNAVSPRRKEEGAIYGKKRRAFLEARPWCEICLKHGRLGRPANKRFSCDVHHTAGRHNGNYLNEATWLAVCREHHMWIHDNPKAAREAGWLK